MSDDDLIRRGDALPERIWAWVWDLPYPSRANGRPEWSSIAYPQEQHVIEYIRADLVTQHTPDPAVQALVEAAREVYRISERDHVARRKLSEALAAFDKTD